MNIIKSCLSTVLVFSATAHAAIIVDLDPGDAFLNVASGVIDTTIEPDDAADGFTMNITFTPTSNDITGLGRDTNAIALLEIGGASNGAGLYMLGGEIYFLSKMNGTSTDVVLTFNDLDFSSGNNMVGVKSSFGVLTAGTEYSVAAIFDPTALSSDLSLGILPTGGSLASESYSFTGVGSKTNWLGNDSISAYKGPTSGGAGAANAVAGSHPFKEGSLLALDVPGNAGQSLMWNSQATLVIPEPSTIFSLGIGMLTLLLTARRRRS